MSVIYRKIRHARYIYIKRNVEKVRGARYTLGARYLSKNTVFFSEAFWNAFTRETSSAPLRVLRSSPDRSGQNMTVITANMCRAPAAYDTPATHSQ